MKSLQVNLNNLAYNLTLVRSLIPETCQICATIKADAYGHGLIEVSQRLVKEGIDYLGLTHTQDAQKLRDLDIKTPILLYLPVHSEEELKQLVDLKLIPFVSDLSYLKNIERLGKTYKTKIPIHIKVDVGMGRYGCMLEGSLPLIDYALESPYIAFEGLCAHLSEAEETIQPATTLIQLERFENLRLHLQEQEKLPPIVHIANSESLVNFPQSHYNLVRPGAMLYGCSPSSLTPPLLPVMSFYSRISFIKRVHAQTPVSYNSLYKTKEEVYLCAIPLGYFDGLDIHLMKRKAQVYIRHKAYPIVGKVCMNTLLVEVPLIDQVEVGDIVEFFGEHQSLLKFSSYYESGSYYDVMCRVGCGKEKTYT